MATRMATLNKSGLVLSDEQIRAERLRKGQCETCLVEPVQCYEIKKRIGGFIRERVALTESGKVYNGICLNCHPDKDPRTMIRRGRSGEGTHRKRSHHHHHRDPHPQNRHNRPHHQNGQDQAAAGRPRRPSRPLPYNIDGESPGDDLERTRSAPNVKQERRPTRERGFINLSDSLRDGDQDRERNSQSLPTYLQQESSAAHLQVADEYEREQEDQHELEYVEEITYNIFNEPVIVRKQKRRSKRSSHQDAALNSPSSPMQSGRGSNGVSPHNSPRRPSRGHHNMPNLPYEEKVGEHVPENFNNRKSPPDTNGGNMSSFRRQDSGPRRASPQQNSGRQTMESKSSGENESLDALAQLIRQHCAANPEETVKFVPGTGTLLPNSELQLHEEEDDLSILTPDTAWQGRPSLATMGTRQRSRKTNLTAISETAPSRASSGASSGKQRSLVSHQIVEPVVPSQAASSQNMESYLEERAPHLLTLREIVGQCTQAGADAEAIDVVTQALIHDNATSMSMDLALFCLTTLWVLARKSDENKRKIIFDDATFEVIIEAMRIYCEGSAVIQTRACGVLWSLSMASNDRKHVAQKGGCEAILNAMLAHVEDDALQVMALGALKVLSFDNIGKSVLRAFGALSIVSDIMQQHIQNPSIQSEGCVILGNLAVDEANQQVTPVTDKEVEAVIMGMVAHPDSLEVHEAACFTLMSLASSAANVEIIRRNNMSKESLELAFQKHPDDVGINILTLLRRLKFDSPDLTEGK